ncbi:MAG: transcriptional repressor [Candidatus Aminicenantes bacterium]|nr:transcriptional repressor [Candidatus Aminicenantes bacterium]HHF52093.1 transcriptional repressor [Candidatus Aminicenantes bacterium]
MPSHNWRNRFRGRGSRWTAPREAILNLLISTSKHMSAKEIYRSLLRIYPAIGLTTVYRTLDVLEQMGYLNKIPLGTGENKYELITDSSETHHHHLICTQCGRIIDYTDFEESELIKKAEQTLKTKHGFKITDYNFEFYGICKHCQERR